ncbi:MAG: hypothetical protein WDW38_009152 [Sanguina aurantia]
MQGIAVVWLQADHQQQAALLHLLRDLVHEGAPFAALALEQAAALGQAISRSGNTNDQDLQPLLHSVAACLLSGDAQGEASALASFSALLPHLPPLSRASASHQLISQLLGASASSSHAVSDSDPGDESHSAGAAEPGSISKSVLQDCSSEQCEAALALLPVMCAHLDVARAEGTWIQDLYRRLSSRSEPSVREAAAQHLLPLCSAQPPALCHTFLLPLLLRLAADKVWAVRRALAVTLAGLLQLTCRTAAATPGSSGGTDTQEAGSPSSSALQDPNPHPHPGSEPCRPSSSGHAFRETEDPSSPTRQILDLYTSKLAVDPSRWQQLPQLVELFCSSSSSVQGAEAAATLLTCAECFALVVCKASQRQWPLLAAAHARILACPDARVVGALLRSCPDTLAALLAWGLGAAAQRHLCAVLARAEEVLQPPAQQPQRQQQGMDPGEVGSLILGAFAACNLPLLTHCPASLHRTVLQLLPLLLETSSHELERRGGDGGGGSKSALRCGQWRARLALAKSLRSMADVVDPTLVETHVLPCAVRLTLDPVWAVRDEALQQLSSLEAMRVSQLCLQAQP